MKKGLRYIILFFFLVVGTYMGMLFMIAPDLPKKPS